MVRSVSVNHYCEGRSCGEGSASRNDVDLSSFLPRERHLAHRLVSEDGSIFGQIPFRQQLPISRSTRYDPLEGMEPDRYAGKRHREYGKVSGDNEKRGTRAAQVG